MPPFPPDLEVLREAAAQVARQHALDLVVLFGSAARAGPVAPRDLDIGVKSEGLADLVAITNGFITAIHAQAVDLVDLRRADPVVLFQVARDGMPLFEGRPWSFAEFVSLAARRYADTKKFRDEERRYIEDFVATRANPK